MEHLSSLKTIQVSLLKVSVKAFTPAENSVVLEIAYESKKTARITRTTRLGNANLLARQLMEEVIMHASDEAADFDGESLIQAHALIHNEHQAFAKLVDFFRTLY